MSFMHYDTKLKVNTSSAKGSRGCRAGTLERYPSADIPLSTAHGFNVG